MRKRKDSHDGSPVGDTNILFVPDSSADPSASGVDALMGMIDEAGAPWSESVWLGGMLGGMATGAVAVSGTTTGAMTSVRASDAGTSGGGGGAG